VVSGIRFRARGTAHRGISRLDIEISPTIFSPDVDWVYETSLTSFSQGVNWVYELDSLLRSASATKINVTINIIVRPEHSDRVAEIDDFKLALEDVGRLIVYNELLVRPESLQLEYCLDYDHDGTFVEMADCRTMAAKHLRGQKKIYPAILRSCKQVCYEAVQLIYTSNVFEADAGWAGWKWTRDFVACIGEEQAREVRQLVVSMDDYNDDYDGEIQRATWRERFDFELAASLTGIRKLEIRIDTGAFERPYDWIYHVDF
jgi:hypothetical protein